MTTDPKILTLAFLGDTDELQIPKIISIMDSIADNFSQFNMSLNSLGVFKNINFPTVLWMGIKTDKAMFEIKSALDLQLKSMGFVIETREFKPHLTIGRLKNIDNKKQLEFLLKKFSNEEIGIQKVDEIILFESILKSNGPAYAVVHKSKMTEYRNAAICIKRVDL